MYPWSVNIVLPLESCLNRNRFIAVRMARHLAGGGRFMRYPLASFCNRFGSGLSIISRVAGSGTGGTSGMGGWRGCGMCMKGCRVGWNGLCPCGLEVFRRSGGILESL